MLRYPGGKTKAKKLIYSHAPRCGYDELREPFVGGGSLLWDAPDKRLWFNDINPLIIDYYTTLRDDERFIDEAMTVKAELAATDDVGRRKIFDDARFSLHCLRRNLERLFCWDSRGKPPTWEQFLAAKGVYHALDFLVCNRYAIGAMVRLGRHDLCAFSRTFQCDGFRAVTREKLEHLRSVLRRDNCRLSCLDYSALLCPGDRVWLFLDPPYLMNHHMSPIYEAYFSETQHKQLAKALIESEHHWLLSLGDCQFNHDLYDGMNISYRQYTGAMPNRESDWLKTEMYIRNY